jgi:tRNA pseudouridine55 synthase
VRLASKRKYRDVRGILLFDKPQGLSSNQALQKVRHLYEAEKAGHTGSLDPLATGLLPICFGEATKIAGYLLGSRKAYEAQCRLGVTTTTEDSEGEVVSEQPVPNFTSSQIEAAMLPLMGTITQIPPAYSAIKQDGVALYKRARRGENVQVPSRQVDIYRFELIEHCGDILRLHVECGSGTYVRSLVRDLGERLGCGAHLTALRRLWVDPFRDPQMMTPERLEAAGSQADLDALLLPLERGLEAMPKLQLSEQQTLEVSQGKRFSQADRMNLPLCQAVDARGRLVALVQIDAVGEVRVLRGFNSTPD